MSRKQRLSDVLEICLALVFSGQETIDTALAQYPDCAKDLRPELEAALWLHSKRDLANSHPGFVIASRQRLVNQRIERLGPGRMTAHHVRLVGRKHFGELMSSATAEGDGSDSCASRNSSTC